jgi:hypothetical protein
LRVLKLMKFSIRGIDSFKELWKLSFEGCDRNPWTRLCCITVDVPKIIGWSFLRGAASWEMKIELSLEICILQSSIYFDWWIDFPHILYDFLWWRDTPVKWPDIDRRKCIEKMSGWQGAHVIDGETSKAKKMWTCDYYLNIAKQRIFILGEMKQPPFTVRKWLVSDATGCKRIKKDLPGQFYRCDRCDMICLVEITDTADRDDHSQIGW